MVASCQVLYLSVGGFSADCIVVCRFPEGDDVYGFVIEFVNECANFGEFAGFVDANGLAGGFCIVHGYEVQCG